MTPAARRRTLRDDLLDDLRQGPGRGGAAPVPALELPPLPAAAPRAAAPHDEPTVGVELRITPGSWSSAGWTRGPDGDGVTVRLGPVCLSLGRLRT